MHDKIAQVAGNGQYPAKQGDIPLPDRILNGRKEPLSLRHHCPLTICFIGRRKWRHPI